MVLFTPLHMIVPRLIAVVFAWSKKAIAEVLERNGCQFHLVEGIPSVSDYHQEHFYSIWKAGYEPKYFYKK